MTLISSGDSREVVEAEDSLVCFVCMGDIGLTAKQAINEGVDDVGIETLTCEKCLEKSDARHVLTDKGEAEVLRSRFQLVLSLLHVYI